MQVLKLVYIAHGWNLGNFGNPLINEPVKAWRYGPVVPSLYHAYKHFGSTPIEDCPQKAAGIFSEKEAALMDAVWNGYGGWSGISLSTLTHEPGSPWSITMEKLGQGATISNDLIEDHYRRRVEVARIRDQGE
jgi:uncharacterized phage-associated protein